MEKKSSFNEEERAALHSLAEMFQNKDDRDELRRIMQEGTTLREIILAYRTDRRLVARLKGIAVFVGLTASVIGTLHAMGIWPK